ncbi:hypothetical protein HDU98_009734 [Podochytrium sp. JEL0797]|nr:hypothetical protein HDU98_009734 [Podochytrium sp. JEL0797]
MASIDSHGTVKLQTVLSLVVLVVLFVPVWFYTTQVHRAVLPVEQVRHARTQDVVVALRVAIEAKDGEVSISSRESIQRVLNEAVGGGLVFDIVSSAGSDTPTANGIYKVLLNCNADSNALFLSSSRILTLTTQTKCHDTKRIESQLAAALAALFSPEKLAPNASTERPLKFATEYKMMLSLLNADPVSLVTNWDIEPAVETYLKPFTETVRKLYSIEIAAQVQYFTTLAIQPEFVHSVGGHVLYPHHLPHFINSAEWSFGGSPVSTSPPINFAVYIPSESQSPLYIASRDDSPAPLLTTNAFSIPQWGGIAILNPNRTSSRIHTNPLTNVKTLTLSEADLEAPLNVFLEQLRSLLGVKRVEVGEMGAKLLPGFTFSYEESSAGITKWELDRLTRYTTLKNVRDAVSTLNSLVTLIESMENMVVLDHIRDEIALSLDSIAQVGQSLSATPTDITTTHQNHHDIALAASRVAITAAERAFFDPTMVSLLYFPDEHKLAVYLPLFLPVGVPLVSTIVQEIKKYIQKRKEAGAAGKLKTE